MDVVGMVAGTRRTLAAKRVFGDPVMQDGTTVLPVARVSAGGGAGTGGPGPHGERPGGGGYGLNVVPAGVFVIRDGGRVSWRPALDVNRVILGGQIVAVVGLLVLRSWLKRRGNARGTAVPAARRRPAAPSERDDPPLSALMSDRLVAIVPDAGLPVALQLMWARDVRHLPVLDGTRVTGVIAEADVARELAQRPAGTDGVLVGDVCLAVTTLGPDDRRSAAVQAMRTDGVDAVLVADGDRLVGIVTATDLIRSLAGEDATAHEGSPS